MGVHVCHRVCKFRAHAVHALGTASDVRTGAHAVWGSGSGDGCMHGGGLCSQRPRRVW